MQYPGTWYVAPDGTVYSDQNPPPWEGPWTTEFVSPSSGLGFVHPQSPPDVLEQAQDWLESQSRIERNQAEAEYLRQKAESERRRRERQ